MSDEIVLPVPPVLESMFVVYGKLGSIADAKTAGAPFVDRVASGPMRDLITKFIGLQWVQARVVPRAEGPEDPPMRLLRAMRMTEEEERRFAEATHLAFVTAIAPLRHPPFGLFAARTLARGLADASDGVVLEPYAPRVLPIAKHEERIPDDGRVDVASHVVCPMSTAEDGSVWLTTIGMQKFGLPNFEIRGIPPNLSEALVLANAVAQHVLDRVFEQAEAAGDEPLERATLPAELRIDADDVARAHGREPSGGGGTTVRLAFDGAARNGMEPFIAIGAPAGFAGGQGEWLYRALGELVGKTEARAPVMRPSRDEALRRALERAVAEWPGIRTCFIGGLAPGHTLFVKRGFPVDGEGREFMWVAVVALQNGEVQGALANDSAYVSDMRAGKRVSFPDAEVFDWMISDGRGGREGGYSIEALTS